MWIAKRWEGHFGFVLASDAKVPFPITAALGIGGEAGEVQELLKKHFRDAHDPGEDLKLELGDLLHYLVVIAQSYDLTLAANIAKLEARDAARGKKS